MSQTNEAGTGAQRTQPKRKRRKTQTRADGRPVRNGQASAAGTLHAFDPWARASQVALIGLFVIALLWCTYVAQPVIVPVLLAWVIATIVLPIVTWLCEHKVPRVVAVIAVTIALVVLIVSLLVLLSTPVTFWLGRATELSVLIKQKLQTMNQPLALLDEVRKALNAIGAGGTQPALKVEQESATVVTTIFAVLTPAVSQFILFIGALIFYLVYQTRLRNTAVLLFPDREARLTTLHMLSDIDENMTKYFGTFTIVNLCLGAATVLLTWAVGLPNPAAVGRARGPSQLHPLYRACDRRCHARGGRPPHLSDTGRSLRRPADLSRHRHRSRDSFSRRRSWAAGSSSTRSPCSWRSPSAPGCWGRSALSWRCRC